ncbi:MAG: hypothetical protein ABJO29_16385 [Yoonia sp.]|uniref:hypothetical protein n=1 Tax=Rhodobacterales TaxID=204455 RepID=UPI001FF5FB45|nr:hypothetical protein [Loktanella sp. F6476L]MCK0120608.1 hypothetical protein [Loktanella sp. F6476L]UWQ99389.1 hypothetical protein K3729_00890 [Rhodobacteraceae bacterium S2214]
MKKTLTCLLISAAVPAVAQTAEVFELPAGCDAYLTIQTEACSVDHIFTCEGDAEGHQRRISIGENGVTYAGEIDEETQWVESFHVGSGHVERLEAEPRDRASFSELVEMGIDTYDFMTESEEVGKTRYVGQDSLTGEQITIDGVVLDQTQYNITAYDEAGDVKWASEGNEYISQRFNMFLAGSSKVTTENGTFDNDDNPVEFIFPGEPGFLSANPKHGCGETLSSAPSLIQRLESLNDKL